MPVNFLNLESKDRDFRKGIYKDPYDEPTYLTFALDFDLTPTVTSKASGLFESSPLFVRKGDGGGVSGCQDYLINRGYPSLANNMERFRQLLGYVSDNTPWYFQSVKGIDKLWKASTEVDNGYKAKDLEIEVETLESLDLRISNLAALYRNAIYDKKYMRERVPDNMRWFKMDIWIAEFRNLRNTLPALVNVGDFASVNLGALGGLLGASRGDENSSSGNVLANFGFIKFKCRQCEFDFSDTFAAGPDIGVGANAFDNPNNNKFKIKIGWFEEESSFASGDALGDNWNKAGGLFASLDQIGNLPIIGDKLSSLSSSAAQTFQDVLNTPARLANQAGAELRALAEGGNLGEVNPFGYASNGDVVPENTAVPKRQNGNSL